MCKAHSALSATLLDAQDARSVILITVDSGICKPKMRKRELEKGQERREECLVSKWLLQKPSKTVCAYAVTSVNVQLGQCYDIIIIHIYAALCSLQSTSTCITMFDIHPLSWRSNVLNASPMDTEHSVGKLKLGVLIVGKLLLL